MARYETAVVRPAARGIEMNRVLKNTYILLSMTLLFSALTAGLSMAMNFPPLGPIITLVGYFGLLFLTRKFRNSVLGTGVRLCVDRIHGTDSRAYPELLYPESCGRQ